MMRLFFFILFVLKCCLVQCQDVADISNQTTVSIIQGDEPSNSSETIENAGTNLTNNTMNDEDTNQNAPTEDEVIYSEENIRPEVILDTATGVNIPHDCDPKIKFIKPFPASLLEKFSPVNFLKPIQEKWDSIRDHLSQTYSLNYGGVQFLSPQQIWEKLHEKGHHFLTGINGAIYGIADLDNYDYPFAYRKLDRSKRSSSREALSNYKEQKPFVDNYKIEYEKLGNSNKSYEFPFMIKLNSIKHN